MNTPETTASPSKRHVLIAGGGIGGLTLARALQHAGLRATVFERAEALRPVGAGILVQMNGMRALRHIGADAGVVREGQILHEAAVLDAKGRAIARTRFEGLTRELGVPGVAIHRGRLQAVLLEGLGPEQVRTGLRVEGFQDEGHQVTVTLSDGSTASGDVLVGADGLHSVVRRALLGDTPLRYSGYTSWRGVTTYDLPREPGSMSESWGPGARFGLAPIGHGQTYWFATKNAPEGVKDEPGRARASLLETFGAWHAPIAQVLEATPEENFLRVDIHDRPPVTRWSQGRVTLLGDAAHPMTPNMGQGGGQAIEDAVVLAGCLAREADLPTALADYERRRVERANSFVTRALQLGRVAQMESAPGRFVRDTLMRLVPESAAVRQVRALMQFEL